jgi:hypothetical protein
MHPFVKRGTLKMMRYYYGLQPRNIQLVRYGKIRSVYVVGQGKPVTLISSKRIATLV